MQWMVQIYITWAFFPRRDECQYVHYLDVHIQLFLKSYILFDCICVQFFKEIIDLISNRIFFTWKLKNAEKLSTFKRKNTFLIHRFINIMSYIKTDKWHHTDKKIISKNFYNKNTWKKKKTEISPHYLKPFSTISLLFDLMNRKWNRLYFYLKKIRKIQSHTLKLTIIMWGKDYFQFLFSKHIDNSSRNKFYLQFEC